MTDSLKRLAMVLVPLVLAVWGLQYLDKKEGGKAPSSPKAGPAVVSGKWGLKTPTGLQYKVLKAGAGQQPRRGQKVTVHYTGWLLAGRNADGSPKKGKSFDSSRRRGRPFSFRVGMRQVIRGWDEALASMKVGERRLLVIPPGLGYGSRGAGRSIPPNSTLVFDVELLGVR